MRQALITPHLGRDITGKVVARAGGTENKGEAICAAAAAQRSREKPESEAVTARTKAANYFLKKVLFVHSGYCRNMAQRFTEGDTIILNSSNILHFVAHVLLRYSVKTEASYHGNAYIF